MIQKEGEKPERNPEKLGTAWDLVQHTGCDSWFDEKGGRAIRSVLATTLALVLFKQSVFERDEKDSQMLNDN